MLKHVYVCLRKSVNYDCQSGKVDYKDFSSSLNLFVYALKKNKE